MYKTPQIGQEEAFSLFMHELEPWDRKHIGFDIKGDLGRALKKKEKVELRRQRGQGSNNDKIDKNLGIWVEGKGNKIFKNETKH